MLTNSEVMFPTEVVSSLPLITLYLSRKIYIVRHIITMRFWLWRSLPHGCQAVQKLEFDT